MRGGLSTIQQTLTPEAAEVLKASMAEAGRRNHGQTTPLHVAATLLSSPSGFLRQACVRSHPNSSHPLQCRALELCFSVALERLPATATAGVPVDSPPPPSNALMAALKRAQAHQRRGCPEQQQPPLLAVKVELEQLVISILDDPGVSRVMREASFSSPAVKAAIQQSQPPTTSGAGVGLGFRPSLAPPMGRNMYVNPRLQQGNPVQLEPPGNEVTKRILDIFSRSKKRNPILVGENEPQSVMNEFWMKFAKEEFAEGVLRNIEVIQLDKGLGSDKVRLFHKIRELGPLIEAKVGDSHGNGGFVLDLGDLKWLVEAQPPGEAEAGRGVVDEVAKVLARFGEGGNGRLWLIGTATCETYLRCQIYYPSMETDWDLQAVPIAPRSPFPGMFPRLGVNGILNSSVESLSPMKTFQSPNAMPRRVPGNLDPAKTSSRCPQCSENYEQELAKLVADEYEKSSSEVRSEPAVPPLPPWLQKAKFDNGGPKSLDKSQTKDQEMAFKQKTEELQKKWSDTCLRLHPDSHNNLRSQRVGPPMTLYNPKLLLHQPLQNKLLPNNALGASLQLNSGAKTCQPLEKLNSHPRSPVRTDLALGRSQITKPSADENVGKDCVKDLLGCISSDFQVEKCAKALDTDSYKMLLKKLMEKVWWQKEAASKVASIVTKCKTGDGKRQGTQSKGGTWLLFTGSDRIGKKKMVSAISEQICGSNPITISLGRRRSDEETAMNFRGKTVLDRIVEAVRRNPFSVIMLEDIDEANMLVRGSITRAMERGRLADSYGREISLGNVIFILTTNWLPNNVKKLSSDRVLDEDKLGSVSSSGWQLRLRICEKRAKRRLDWLHDRDRLTMPRRESNVGLSLDLNLMADFDDDRTDGSLNSSDLTTEHDDDQIRTFPITSVPIELADFIDDPVVFKPVDTVSVRNEIRNKISEKFSNIVDDISLDIEEEALENILGGVWFGQTDLEEWGDKVLLPSFRHIKTVLPSAKSSDEKFVVRLEIDGSLDTRGNGDLLPSSIRV